MKIMQPPSGGCVLKRRGFGGAAGAASAAFRRLCVETAGSAALPPAGGQPPSGGCVLKRKGGAYVLEGVSSRLQAAVC